MNTQSIPVSPEPQENGASSDVKCNNQEPKEVDSRKRERESLSFSGMLSWLRDYAKRANEPSDGDDEFLAQALLAREALFTRHQKTNYRKLLQMDMRKKPKDDPSLYEDRLLDSRWTETLRCRRKTICLTKYCDSHAMKKNVLADDGKKNQNEHKQAQGCTSSDELNSHNPSKIPVHKPVLVGPAYQADVPQWTGVISESDPKWLGTRMWSPKLGETKSAGRSQQHSCNCDFPNFVECVRFHIAEKRFHLKQELGVLFYRWGFDRMGEEISLSWTKDEEKKFKNLLEYAKFPKKFWKYAALYLPNKKRDDLVSYYFNVYIYQRRSYENRVTPHDINSDRDEPGCGRIGDGFGYKALHAPGSESLSCTLNRESTDLL